MSIRGVIFDFDGTIADTLPDIAAAVNAGLRAFGRPEQPAALIRDWVGEGLPTLCRRATANESGIPLDEMVKMVTEYYRDHRLDLTAPFPGIPELLDELTARGLPFAILTNKPHEHTLPMADALFHRWTFAAIEGYQQESRRKPDPRTALDIAARMGLPPSEVAFVGDSFTDVTTALNAGMLPVGVTWGYRHRQELLDAGAAHLIDTPGELLRLL